MATDAPTQEGTSGAEQGRLLNMRRTYKVLCVNSVKYNVGRRDDGENTKEQAA